MTLKRLTACALFMTFCLGIAPIASLAQSSPLDAVFAPIEVSERVQNKMVGVRLWDFWKYLPKVVEDLKDVEKTLMNSPERFINVPNVKKVYNLFLREAPTQSGTIFKLPLTYFIRDGNDVLRFEKVDVIYTSSKDMSAIARGSILLKETNFRVDVSLIDRRAIVSDRSNDLIMVFPVGVGAFDVNVLHDSISLLTPRFKTGYLDKRTAMYERNKPRYYAGKPFIRLTTNESPDKGWTGIGFHAQPNLGEFVRAFDSHGCMRMQLDDLYTLYWIVAQGPRQHTPITVSYEIDGALEHPFPKREMPWKKVNNIGTLNNPQYNIDRDGLTEIVIEWKEEAPIEELMDLAEDNYHGLYNYDMDWREKERMIRHEAMCRQRYLSNKENDKLFGLGRRRAQREYEKCVKEGRKEVDLSDRLYRFWIH